MRVMECVIEPDVANRMKKTKGNIVSILRKAFCLSAFMAAFLILSPSAFAGDIGVILMHGKDGTSRPKSPIGKLAGFLEGDFKVTALTMAWSRDRGWEKTLEETFAEIDAAVAEMKSAGAAKIVVGGHSMGAATALAYATRTDGLAGVVMLAPGHRPDLRADDNFAAITKAKELVEAGKPDDDVEISDRNQGKDITRVLQADVALSWFDPDGLAVMQNAAPKVRPGTPVLFAIGQKDRLLPVGKDLIFDAIPANDKSAYIVVPGGHKVTPIKAKSQVADWLNTL